MHRGLVWLVASCVLAAVGFYAWTHRQQVAESVAVAPGPVAEARSEYTEEKIAQQVVTITGPLADYMSRQSPGQAGTPQSSDSTSSSSRTSREPTEADRVGDSPVGTSTPILHKTFAVVALVDLPFDIPPHAASPKLRGTYRSFTKGAVGEDGTDADVEFLLMTEQEYNALLGGRPSDAVFSAEDAHNQEVNVILPPTYVQPARYYLVFRNNSRDSRKKVVQADFQVDF